MSSDSPSSRPGGADAADLLADRLGYLLKHAQQQLWTVSAAALKPFGISGRELAVLIVLADAEPASQQQAAQRLGVDRTTMVALLDALETIGLVARRPHAHDRRRNIVELTGTGRETLRAATAASDAAEQRFLAPLDPADARRLKESLRLLIRADHGQDPESLVGNSGTIGAEHP